LCGGRTDAERRAALRQYTEQPVRQGAVECPWGRLVAGLVLGTETSARSLQQGLRVKEREQREARNLVRPVAWEEIILALERARERNGRSFEGGMVTGARTRRYGLADGRDGCHWPGWGDWRVGWITQR
jgi:hypothetical protein